jgi:hypothetical protein
MAYNGVRMPTLPWGEPARRSHKGFLVRWFEWLNNTWPHPRHRLINGAVAAVPLQNYVECLWNHLPPLDELDLVVLELGSMADTLDPSVAENIVRRLHRGTSSPLPIVFITVRSWCRHEIGQGFSKTLSNAVSAPSRKRRIFWPGETTRWAVLEAEVSRVCHHYGQSCLSVYEATHDAVDAHELTLEDVARDCLHPLYGRLGTEHLTDILVHWTTLAARLHAGGFLSRGSIRFGKRYSLPRPLHASQEEVGPVSKCYSFGPPLPGEPRAQWRTSNCVRGGGRLDGACSPVKEDECPKTDETGTYLSRLPRVWVFCERSLAGRNKKRSPGIVGFTPGATAFLRLPPPSHSRDLPGGYARLHVALSYLTSYEHMGQALVRCHGWCSCDPQAIDAHRAAEERNNSVYRVHRFDLSGTNATYNAHACEIEIQVLPQTTSGEHKFKIQQLSIAA